MAKFEMEWKKANVTGILGSYVKRLTSDPVLPRLETPGKFVYTTAQDAPTGFVGTTVPNAPIGRTKENGI